MSNGFPWLLMTSELIIEFKVTKELASMDSLLWNNYRWEYFQRGWERTNSIQSEVESARCSSKTMIVVKICMKEKGLFGYIYKTCETVKCLFILLFISKCFA